MKTTCRVWNARQGQIRLRWAYEDEEAAAVSCAYALPNFPRPDDSCAHQLGSKGMRIDLPGHRRDWQEQEAACVGRLSCLFR